MFLLHHQKDEHVKNKNISAFLSVFLFEPSQLRPAMEHRASVWAKTPSRTLTAAACLCSPARIPWWRTSVSAPPPALRHSQQQPAHHTDTWGGGQGGHGFSFMQMMLCSAIWTQRLLPWNVSSKWLQKTSRKKTLSPDIWKIVFWKRRSGWKAHHYYRKCRWRLIFPDVWSFMLSVLHVLHLPDLLVLLFSVLMGSCMKNRRYLNTFYTRRPKRPKRWRSVLHVSEKGHQQAAPTAALLCPHLSHYNLKTPPSNHSELRFTQTSASLCEVRAGIRQPCHVCDVRAEKTCSRAPKWTQDSSVPGFIQSGSSYYLVRPPASKHTTEGWSQFTDRKHRKITIFTSQNYRKKVATVTFRE